MAIAMGNAGNGEPVTAHQIDAVRRFNRFYTVELGILDQGLLDSPLSLTEARVMYELFHHDHSTAADLGKQLRIDPGYLSRILRRFGQRGWLARQASASDRRQVQLRLTRRGQRAFTSLDKRSRDQIAALLGRCTASDKSRMVGAMEAIERALVPSAARGAGYVIRQHRHGDLGWIVERHGALYAAEYGMPERFEGAGGAGRGRLPGQERSAARALLDRRARRRASRLDHAGAKSKRVAKLRVLLVDPRARGLGVGAGLVDECVRFARQAGYRTIMLWTMSGLHAARHIYQAHGFELVEEAADDLFPPGQIGQTWELTL